MTDRQGSPPDSVYVPGPVPEKKPARELFHAEGWQLRQFVIACLRALLADPKSFLAVLAPHRPPERMPGRPQRQRG